MNLDILITISATTPAPFVNECRRSVRAAVDRCSFAARVIEVPGVPGNIGQAMLNGVAMSSAEYVAWVDDDDFVLPNAFTCLGRHFAAQPDAICAREIKWMPNGRWSASMHRHHLTAWRRTFLTQHPPVETAFPLHPLFETVKNTAVDEFSWVYVRRIRASEGARLRSQHFARSRGEAA